MCVDKTGTKKNQFLVLERNPVSKTGFAGPQNWIHCFRISRLDRSRALVVVKRLDFETSLPGHPSNKSTNHIYGSFCVVPKLQ